MIWLILHDVRMRRSEASFIDMALRSRSKNDVSITAVRGRDAQRGDIVVMRAPSWVPRSFRFVLALVAAMALSPFKQALADEATDRARVVVSDLASDIWANIGKAKAEGRRQRLAEAIKAKTNVDILSRLSLGKNWRRLNPEQQNEYQRLFSIVIMDALAGRLDLLLGELSGPLDQHFKVVDSMRVGKRDVLVRSKVIALADAPLSVDWRLRESDEGPFIIDLVIEGISLLVSQRAEFAAVIGREQADGLIQALRRRVPRS